MLRTLSYLLFVLGALAFVACGDDTKAKTPDKGIKLPEASVKKEQGITPGLEQGITPGKEQGITPGKEQGVPTAGLGNKCSQAKPCPDPATMKCVTIKSGATDGFCTKDCPVADFGGKPCTGGPAGTGFFCIFGDKVPNPTVAACGFVCKAKDSSTGQTMTFPCPTELTCGTPDANGNAICEP